MAAVKLESISLTGSTSDILILPKLPFVVMFIDNRWHYKY